MVLIAIGDHQPPAAVSGRDQPWTVPVHVFGRRGPIFDRFVERGFRSGLEPHRAPIGPMHSLAAMFLEVFSPAAPDELDAGNSGGSHAGRVRSAP